MGESISISVCVPAINEEKTLKETVDDLVSTLSSYVQKLEIIIVDDGSTDYTPWLAEEIARTYLKVKVIHHKENLGIGTCYRNALAIAQGDYFSWFPGDHENSAEEFVQCLPYLKNDTLVTCHHKIVDPRSFFRRFISSIYTLGLNKYFHLDLKYYNGLTIFPTSVLRSLPLVSNGFVVFAEGLIRAVQRGCQVVELPAILRKRRWGKSKALTILSVRRTIRDLLRVLIEQKHRYLKI